jgi:hypothetical protein
MTTIRRFCVIVSMIVLPMLGDGLGHTADESCMSIPGKMFNPCADIDVSSIQDLR